MLELLERLRAASLAQDAGGLAALYAEDGVHQVSETTLVVEQEALGSNTITGAQFVLPNVWVIETDAQGLISKLRDYVNPVAVTEALGEVTGAFDGEVSEWEPFST